MFRRSLLVAYFAAVLPLVILSAQADDPPHPKQGSGIIIELDNAFITKYMDRATINGDFKPTALSKIHKADKDGEVHVAGMFDVSKLPTVAEVMNAKNEGKAAEQALRTAAAAGKTVKIEGAWRLWCEHSGTLNQIQGKPFTLPQLGVPPSNPDHVFEIHPVTTVTPEGGVKIDALPSISDTPGHQPHDAVKAFQLGYENVPCKIVPLEGDRTRIITKGIGFNFVEFIIRANEAPKAIADGHTLMASVLDTDGELVIRRRRMVFIKGTDADTAIAGATEGKRFKAIGIPRISLKLVDFRVRNKDNIQFDKPLEWDLPYEMIIVSADPVTGSDD